MARSKMLLDKDDLRAFNAKLACEIGTNEAIALQQVHYWLKINKKADRNYKNGRYWTYNTYDEWLKEAFPFWSKSTLRRSFNSLEDQGLLITSNFNNGGFDKTKWYSIDYDKVAEIEDEVYNDASVQNEQSSVQNEQMDCSKRTARAVQNEQTNTKDLPKNSTDNIYTLWEEIFQTTPNRPQELLSYEDDLPLDVLEEALKRTKEHCDNQKWYYRYFKGIVNNWLNKNVNSLEDVEKLDKKHKQSQEEDEIAKTADHTGIPIDI